MSASNNLVPKPRAFPWLLLLAVPLLAMITYFAMRKKIELPAEHLPQTIAARDRTVTLGGIQRPASDMSGEWSEQQSSENSEQYEIDPSVKLIYGSVPVLKPDANPTVEAVHTSMTNDKDLQQLSPMVLPVAFDQQAYLSKPEAYLKIHEPGRVFQSAQPGPGVPILKPEGPRAHILKQGETVRLQVRTEASMPVTFASFDIGLFDNGLTSITVAANEQGIAEATYHAAPGKIGEVNILAASPVASEQVKFDIWIRTPTVN